MQFEPGLLERVAARLRGQVRGAREIPNAPPDVDLVGNLAAEDIVAIVVRLTLRTQRPIGRLPVGGDLPDRVDMRQEPRLHLRGAGESDVICGDRRREVRVRGVDLRLEIVEGAVVETAPPRPGGRELGSASRFVLVFG